MSSLRRVVSAALFTLAAGSTQLSAQSFIGTTTGQPTWRRPVANGSLPPTPPLSGVGTAVGYSFQYFVANVTGSYSFLSTASLGWDNYTFLYGGSFNAGSPFTNVLIGNDDNPNLGLSGFTYNLTAGTVYAWVTTGFANTDAGAFTNLITGPADVTLLPTSAVPEPSTWALMGVGLLGLGAAARRRTTRSTGTAALS